MQSVPYAQTSVYSEPGPPSSQSPSKVATTHALVQMRFEGGGGEGEGGGGEGGGGEGEGGGGEGEGGGGEGEGKGGGGEGEGGGGEGGEGHWPHAARQFVCM